MTFAAPGWLLLGLVGVALVAVLHARKRRTIVVSSIRLWRSVVQEERRRSAWKLPRVDLPLILQMALLLLLALALARPLLLRGVDAWDHWIVVIDGSESMSALDVQPSRFEAGLAEIEAQLQGGSLGGVAGRTVSVFLADAAPRPLAARLRSMQAVRGALAEAAPMQAPVDWDALAARLPAVVAPDERLRVTILTDSAGGDEAKRAVEQVLPTADVEPLIVGDAMAANVALADLAVTPLDLGEDLWEVRGTIERHAEEDRSVTVTIGFDPANTGTLLEWDTFVLESDEREFVREFSFGGAGRLEVRIEDDVLPSDNARYAVLNDRVQGASVLLVGDPQPALERALAATEHVETYRAAELPGSTSDHDLVIVNGDVGGWRPRNATLWLGATPLDEGGAVVPPDGPTAVGRDGEHPLLASVDWSSIALTEFREVPRLPGAEVLLSNSGRPLVQARLTAWGPEVAIAFELADSNWHELPGFPVFVRNAVRWSVPGFGTATSPSCLAGAACPLDPRWLARDGRVLGPLGEEVDLPAAFVDPAAADGAPWLPHGFATAFRPRTAGVYTASSDGVSTTIAVNRRHSSESALLAPSARATASTPGGAPALPSPLARWVLLLGLAVLIVETWWVAWRTEGTLRRASFASGNRLRWRRTLQLALRTATVVLLTMAVTDVAAPVPLREQHVALVADDPAWYPERSRPAVQDVIDAVVDPRRPGTDRGAFVQIGQLSHVRKDFGSPTRYGGGTANAPGVNLEDGLTTALALLPPDGPRRIVVAAPDAETRGGAWGPVARAARAGIPIDYLPLNTMPTGEVLVEEMHLPSRLHPRDRFRLQAVVYAQRATEATIRILRDGATIGERRVFLEPGRNRTSTVVAEGVAGRYVYSVEVEAEGDAFASNNRISRTVRVERPASVAIVASDRTAGETLARGLDVQGIAADLLRPDDVPWRAEGWNAFDVVILMDVPALALHSDQQAQLEAWVGEHGGGLLVTGGENSFGPGGYYQTSLETISPLSSRVADEAPEAALMFVVDRSGSMQQRVDETSRLEIAKEATREAIGLLSDESWSGVIVFDEEPDALVPMQKVADLGGLDTALRSLQPGGGTSLYPAMVEALGQMRNVDAEPRHVVVLTDGLSQPGDFEGILARFAEEGITVSTVAIGRGSHRMRLQNIARWGGGTFHVTEDFRALPSILTREAMLLSNSPVRRDLFRPTWTERRAPFMEGVAEGTSPSLAGYVRTTAKPRASVHLVGPEDDPIMASWQYGLGRVVTFASHGAGAWSGNWIGDADYPLLWSQVVRWLVPAAPAPGLRLQATAVRDELRVHVEATRADDSMYSGLSLVARVTPSDAGAEAGSGAVLALLEVRDGVYEATLPVRVPGVFDVRVERAANDEGPTSEAGTDGVVELSAEATVHFDYPARFAFSRQDDGLALALPNATGGRLLLGDASIFPATTPLRWILRSGWPLWTTLALTVFLLELYVRYGGGRPFALRGR